MAERFLGKKEVEGPIPSLGSRVRLVLSLSKDSHRRLTKKPLASGEWFLGIVRHLKINSPLDTGSKSAHFLKKLIGRLSVYPRAYRIPSCSLRLRPAPDGAGLRSGYLKKYVFVEKIMLQPTRISKSNPSIFRLDYSVKVYSFLS